MDTQNQPQFNPKIPISEVLKQEQTGYTPSAPTQKATLTDVVDALRNNYNDTNNIKPPVNPTPNTQPVSQTKIIKTYKSDAAEAARMQQASVARIAMAQDDRRRAQGEEIGAAPKKGHGLLLLAVILILLGAAAVPTVNYILNRKTVPVQVSLEKTIIPFDHQSTLIIDNATREAFLSALTNASTSGVTANINYIKVLENIQDVNKKTITQQVAPDIFAGLIGPNMPSALARSFDSDYMYGLDGATALQPFILFKTSSYEQTFANMLKWENKMITDLTPVLGLAPDVALRPFTDQVVINKDIRAVSTTDGTIVFLYGFLDNQTLIITTNTQTFQDINTRYIAGQFVQ